MIWLLDISSEPCKNASTLQLSPTSLPTKGTVLLWGNFMLLDKNVQPDVRSNVQVASSAAKESSYVDIAFGDDRKCFAGFHRCEVVRDNDPESLNGVTIWLSSISCNPSRNHRPFPNLAFTFHKLYARSLFSDGIAEVLKD